MIKSLCHFNVLRSQSNFKKLIVANRKLSIDLYDRIFINYIEKETDAKWLYNDRSNCYVMKVPILGISISILDKVDPKQAENIHIISLLPISEWLFREKFRVLNFNESKFSWYLKNSFPEKNSLIDKPLNSYLFVNFLTKLRPTGRIVSTITDLNSITFIGSLKPMNTHLMFWPYNRGCPEIHIETDKKYSADNQACKIIEWTNHSVPKGKLLFEALPTIYNHSLIFHDKFQQFPNADSTHKQAAVKDLKSAISNLLKVYKLTDEPFSDKDMECVPASAEEFVIPQHERDNRKDFTAECIISIDPDDAKDIDDALHIQAVSGGNYLVGVHIADVSYFIKPDTALDCTALHRASSIYLKHKVIPMLPPILSEHLCSLNPNEDKLAFSIMLLINPDGEIISEKFTKSVIRPKFKLSYKQANALINGDTDSSLATNPHYEKAVESLLILDKLATVIRKRRVDSGALIINKPTVNFTFESKEFDSSNTNDSIPEPNGLQWKILGRSNFLIEEFMLLANQASAKLLFNNFLSSRPNESEIGAFLRKHPSPEKIKKSRWYDSCKRAGFRPESKDLNSIMEVVNQIQETEPHKALGLSFLTYINMNVAEYCCAENCLSFNDPEQEVKIINDPDFPFHHYGLNVPLYTHFTSPIRRYADIVVHRQLSAIIKGENSCGISLSQRLEAAHNCNVSRIANRRMNDNLTSVYMASYLNQVGWRLVKGILINITGNSVIVLLTSSGILHRCELRELAPWASRHVEQKAKKNTPVAVSLTYNSNKEDYSITMDKGFPRYVYRKEDDEKPRVENVDWNKLLVKNHSKSRGKMQIDLVLSKEEEIEGDSTTQEMNCLSQDKREIRYADELFNLTLFEELNFAIYCKDNLLALSVELPFPPISSMLDEDSNRIS